MVQWDVHPDLRKITEPQTHSNALGFCLPSSLRTRVTPNQIKSNQSKPSFRHTPCARTHSAHTKVQLYRFARRAVLVHTTATSSLICHVITWSGDISHISGKDMRKKDEEWPRTGTFCAGWGRMIAQTLSGYSSKRPIVTNFRSFSRGFHVHTCTYMIHV